MKFSQRIGKTPVRSALQVDDIDRELANLLWNSIHNHLISGGISRKRWKDGSMEIADEFARVVWLKFLKNRIDQIPKDSFAGWQDSQKIFSDLGKWFFENAEWYEKYDFVEFIIEYLFERSQGEYDVSFINQILEKEHSGYRIINKKIVPITSEQEIQEIENALELKDKWAPICTHLETALQHLSNRKKPDYRNSVKESISAVEAICRIATNKTKFADALKELDKEHKLHGSLKTAFSNLYGYTSDADGIRHAILQDGHPVTQEDARFMLIACSAFVNYIKVKFKS